MCMRDSSKGHFGVHEIDEAVLDGMTEWLPMAPLHNAAYIKAIEVMREVLPEARFVGAVSYTHLDLYKRQSMELPALKR